jgi:hypothetical protein
VGPLSGMWVQAPSRAAHVARARRRTGERFMDGRRSGNVAAL